MELVEAGSIKLDEQAPQIVDAGSITLDRRSGELSLIKGRDPRRSGERKGAGG